ncbi:hypothetical protein DEU56DRAFT_885849 [Suillus clintonianus]|uniref:uncharacterized protein n=1 Tax=Suillus clintonianus TaxID=1904413 RepID=UPI001B87458E|nr:uncharacterized protein DEU56DRAFT_885849 [Suillus clintonianus]KAG2140668.1 hypothetical protein DEU56DRAFT_885849 [Suillus clintonianus]
MEISSPGLVIQHQVENNAPDPANPSSNSSRYRRGNHPRTHLPPVNATNADVVVAPEIGGTSSRQPRRNVNQNRSRDHEQGSSNPRRPPGASQTAGSSSVAGGTGDGDVRSKRTRPPRRHQGATAANELNVSDSQPQSQLKRPSRRSKFNASLSEPTPIFAGDSKLEVKVHPPPQASSLPKKIKPPKPKAPLPDDLTSTLTRALSTHPYPDCPICFNPIRPEQPTWSCSSSDPSENLQCCWTTFHLKCIRAWASKSVKDLQDAWRARGEERTGEWRCPGCQAKREHVPSNYRQVLLIYSCFCYRIADPSPTRLVTPHSCAYPCSRVRASACGHGCPLLCHPGPCPPCAVTVRKGCWCGRQVSTVRCSSLESPNSTTGISCGVTCSKPLSCGNPQHECSQVCHPGDCKPCLVTEVVACYCGKETRQVPCGDGKDRAVVCAVEGELGWEGRYECDGVCGRPFACGVHTCEKGCHPPSFTPQRCPLDPSIMQTCACGRFTLPTVEQHDRYTHQRITPTKSDPSDKDIAYFLGPRTSCTIPVPTCKQRCIKTLPDCSHQCGVSCHIGPCPPCTELIERTCRCGATKKMIKCGEIIKASENNEAGEVLCDRACIALRTCGRHQCNRICCPLASLAAAQKGKGKKRAGLLDELGVEEGGLHECDLPCGKLLSCGNHRCERKDHRGVCGVCLQSVYEDLICPCGRTAMEPPIPCGTVMTCSYPCARPSPPCGHSRVPHACHEGVIIAGADPNQAVEASPCPPCPFLTSKQCACGKKMVDNIRCAQERISCGSICGKSLACGFHHCERLCHADDCGTCTAVCGKSRKACLPAQHPCTQTCHAPAACPETEACLALVTLTCPCGLLRSSVPCSQASSTANLKCTGECAIKKRNARLADALGISPEKREGLQANVTYNDDLVIFARANGKLLGLAEKTFADFITSDKRTQVLPHMPPERRKFVHDLASIYRMDTQMVDQEPHRSVQLIRRVDTRIPTPLLSASLPSPSPSPAVLGKLADLRAPKAVSSVTSGSGGWARPQPKVAEAGGRWTSVVARPGSGSGSSSPAPGASSSSGGTQVGTASLSLKPSGGAWVSSSVQRAREAASQEMGMEDETVPDDWEDDV